MNRRMALLTSLFLGGVVPPSLLAQDPQGRKSNTRTRSADSARSGDDDAPEEDPGLPPALMKEPEFQYKRWDISSYTSIPTHVQGPPEKALIDWIMLRTGLNEWHGEHVAVLSANRKYLTAYNSPEVLKQVDEIVERFVKATDDTLRIQVQYIAAVDPRWRYTIYSQMWYVGGGPQGQQIWTMNSRQAALVLTQMQAQQGFRQLAKEGVEVVNGQMVGIKTKDVRTYVGGLQPDPAGGLNFTARSDKIEEGVSLKISPLLNFDGDAVDAKIDLTVNTVRMLHRTKVIAPREVGPVETTIDVPDSTQTHLEQTVRNWKLGQSLIISCGIHPGILDKKTGLFNLPIPGTYPTATEVLVFLEIEAGEKSKVARSARNSRSGVRSAAARSRYNDEDATTER